MHGEPPSINLAEQGAADLVPVCLGVLERRNSLADSLATNRKAGLGDPDRLSANSSLDSGNSVVEKALVLGDVVGHRVLEVRVGIDTDEVAGIDDGLVRSVDPGSPSVNVAYGSRLERGVGDGVTDPLDVAGEFERLSTRVRVAVGGAGRSDAVEILAADGDTGNQAGEGGAPRRNGRLESRKLVVDDGTSSRGPDTEQKARLGGDGRLDGRDGISGSSTLLQ